MKLPSISIIIPCYNCALTLEEAVASCLVQSLQIPFEIVLVDDASTDNTREIMEIQAKKYPNIITSFHQKNLGGGTTRNTAVEKSSGDIIFCLDSDDILPPDTLSKMVDFMKLKNCDGVCFHRSTQFKGNNINDIQSVVTLGYVGGAILFESLLDIDGIFCPLYCVFLFTKDSFTKSGGYPTAHGFDTQGFAWRFLAQGCRAFTCPDTNYLHRIQFNKSYYLREAEAGRINYNWQDIFKEHLFLFDEDTQKLILNFNCKDFTKNIFEELQKRDRVFKKNYKELLGTPYIKENGDISNRKYIKRNSFLGLAMRIKARLKNNRFLRCLVGLSKTEKTINDLKEIWLIIKRNPRRLLKIIFRRLGLKDRDDVGKRYGTMLELRTLQKYASQALKGIVEIGVLDGGTTRELALVSKVPIYGIDPIIPDSMDKDLVGSAELIKKNLDFYKDFHFINDYSYNVVKGFDGLFDFIFIDGDHNYEAVKRDFEDWFPLLEKDGYIAFHDSAPVQSLSSNHHGYSGPIQLVKELTKNDSLIKIETADSLTVFKKISNLK